MLACPVHSLSIHRLVALHAAVKLSLNLLLASPGVYCLAEETEKQRSHSDLRDAARVLPFKMKVLAAVISDDDLDFGHQSSMAPQE